MENKSHNSLSVAIEYLAKGYQPIPIYPNEKRPAVKNWNQMLVDETNIDKLFNNENLNIGVVLGSASNGLVDVDIDDLDAVIFAQHFLPVTDAIFGRKSNPCSHWLYQVSDPRETKQFKIGNEIGTIIEIRGNGSQTVFPGSIHASGEVVQYTKDGEPLEVEWIDLEKAATKISIATVVFKAWKQGNRHSLALSLSGFLVTRGWSEGEITELIGAICEEAGDEELSDRLTCVATTFEQHRMQQPVYWRSGLEEILGKKSVSAFERWLPKIDQVSKAMTINGSNQLTYDCLTDASLADAFINTHKNNLIWAIGDGGWYARKNRIYEKIDPVIVQGKVKSFLQEQYASYGPYSKTVLSRQRINATAELSRYGFCRNPNEFDQDPNLLGLSDGNILNIREKCITSLDGAIITKSANVKFDPAATCPRWIEFLNEIFQGDREIIGFLQRAVGYSLTGSVEEQVAFILIGKGANGKSTFLNVLHHLLADYASTTPMQTLMDQGKYSIQTNDLASIKGKRFVSASEGERDQRIAESKIKLMTGGDQIKCRNLYQEYFEFTPTFKLWLATNNFPSVSGSDDAIWRRLRIVDFPVSIPLEKQDPNLLQSLLKELPGILNWALEGHDDWNKNGLNAPQKVMNSVSEYREENDIIGQWISSCCCLSNPKIMTSIKDLYDSYSNWCLNSGFEYQSIIILGKELSKKGYENIKGKNGNKRRGITLIPILE